MFCKVSYSNNIFFFTKVADAVDLINLINNKIPYLVEMRQNQRQCFILISQTVTNTVQSDRKVGLGWGGVQGNSKYRGFLKHAVDRNWS